MTHSHRFCLIRIRKALENKSNMEDDRVAILEAQLAQAKLIAEEADKKYEEVEFWGGLNCIQKRCLRNRGSIYFNQNLDFKTLFFI